MQPPFWTLAEANEEYVQGMPVLVIGDSSYASGRGQPAMHETKMYYTFMKYCLNVDMPFGTANEIRDQARTIEDTEDFRADVLLSRTKDAYRPLGTAMVIKLSEPNLLRHRRARCRHAALLKGAESGFLGLGIPGKKNHSLIVG